MKKFLDWVTAVSSFLTFVVLVVFIAGPLREIHTSLEGIEKAVNHMSQTLAELNEKLNGVN